MSTSDTNLTDRDDIELLLPWYVNGTLDETEQARVEAYLASTSEFDAQIATLREDMLETTTANELIRGPSAGALDRLMRDIEQEPASIRAKLPNRAGVIAAIEQFLHALTPGRLGFAAMAAAAIIVVQAGLLGSTMLQGGTGYTTASGENTAASGTAFLVQFNPKADITAVAAFLEANKAQIVSGPDDGALFKIRIGKKILDTPAREALMQTLADNEKMITLILPSE